MKITPIQVNYIQHCGNDLSVVNAARVSFHKESFEFSEQDGKLIRYLAKHGHISPFHHAFITLRVKAPVFVARQLVKHKFMPWNEVSRRYVDEEPEFFVPTEWRGKAVDKKQGSAGVVNLSFPYETVSTQTALDSYLNLLNAGVAPEQARMVLPHNLMTEWYWSGTLSAWAGMLNLRLKEDTQAESREVAQQAYNIIKPLFPESISALIYATPST